MKITYKILLINFVIVFIVIGTAASAFYSIMYNVLTTQQSKILLESTNDFIYTYRENLENLEEEFLYINKTSPKLPQLTEKSIDFILKTDPVTQKIIAYTSKENIQVQEKNLSLQVFFSDNPFNITNIYKDPGGFDYYYGKIITQDVLNSLSKRIKSDIAIVWKNSPSEISNENQNKQFSFSLREAYSELLHKNNFDIYTKNSANADLLVTIYKPNTAFNKGSNELQFLIFSSLNAAADLRSSIRDIVLIIGFSGVLISLILTFIFTDKIRKQITDLSKGTELTKEGNLQTRIKVKSNDELGQLATAFNTMLGELEKNQKAKNEYSEFITLLNQNPSLKEVSEASLKKIVLTCGFTVGALYTVENETIILASSFGTKGESELINKELFFSVINSKEPLELNFEKNCPKIGTGIHTIYLNYLLILPIIYNNKVIALLEFRGVEKPSHDVKEYLSNIQEQLAIGLTNAMAFVQLEKLVTELKQLNEDYQKQNVQIRKQNETLIDLHSKLKEKAEELEIQKQKAEESTKLKSQFLASMSHELRTPMNSILGLSELMLEESAIKGKNRERLEVVLKSGKRLMILINDILDLSKIEAGKMEIREENVLLDELLKDVEYSISPLLISKKIDFRVVKDCNTRIIINTDRGKVTQVLVNLLGNAVKFTEDGYVELKVFLENKNICFDVLDTGIGISEENQKIIFDEFRQVDGTTTKKFGGTGLGLTICKRIADLLNGSMSVRNNNSKGSVFTFSVPLNFISELKEEKKIDFAVFMQNRKKPVLIIDKDPDVRLKISDYLKSKGYEVIFAEDGEVGLQKAHLQQPFAIALDILLPNKGGWEVLKDLKNDDKTKDIPVILFSIDENKNTGYGVGAFEFIVKPLSFSQLTNSLKRLEHLSNKRVEKITIVDDEEFEFDKFRNEFNNEKIRIDYIQNSELAFSRILETQPDLIIIDLIMPKLDGISLTYKLKSSKETKHIPIIISTAKEITEEEKQVLNKIVESITVKSKGHPLDVLKIVRDRIRVQEITSATSNMTLINDYDNPEVEIEADEELKRDYFGEILIIDDDADTLFTINEILGPLNCKTYLAKGGLEGIKILENINPDIILLDIMMPIMDGFQTINKIRSNPRLSGIPVYAVTAKAMADDKDIILRNGFTDYIPKPINAGILTSKIKAALTNLNLI